MNLDADLQATFTAEGAAPFAVDAAIDADPGETLIVLGPSGSGKTLLLETLAGFHDHAGHVRLGDRDVTAAPPEDRRFGFVFQEYGLFPHMTVRENVAFGDHYHEDTRDPDALLDSLDAADLSDRTPDTLSGGEKQRVALARALAVRPQALLLDEPLSSLDAPMRASLRGTLAETLADETTIYVTHDRTTARALGDRIAVMADGQIRQRGDPETVFERPASPFVARFTGSNSLPREALPASVRDALAPGTHVAIRPEHVAVRANDADFDADVVRTVREDAAYRVTLAVGGERLDALTDHPPDGDRTGVTIPRAHCHVMTADASAQHSP